MSSMYDRLYLAYKKRYESVLSKQIVQNRCNQTWTELKKDHGKDSVGLRNATEAKIKQLNEEATRKSASFLNYFVQVSKHASQNTHTNSEKNTEVEAIGEVLTEVTNTHSSSNINDKTECSDELDNPKKRSRSCIDDDVESIATRGIVYPKPKQDALENEIKVAESELNCLVTRRDAGFGEDGIDKIITKKRKDLEALKQKLKEKIAKADWQRTFREKKRQKLQNLQEEFPDAAKFLNTKSEGGRPRLESDQDGLLEAIADIALHSGSADNKRRSEAVRACETLNALHEQVKEAGYQLSRSSLYLRLLPRSSMSREGKRHVNTVPVKLCRAQADLHRDHTDQHFCQATIHGLEELASILGPQQVCIISQDDKAKVPLGITAAKTQAPILMHMEYKVRLPDHDWVVGHRHKLTPSVYAGIVIKNNCMGQKEAVTYSGPTHIAIRSGKHSSSTASTHAADFDRLLELDDFQPIMKQDDGSLKPVLMLSVDGGPDENPRYKKVIAHAIQHFKSKNFDAVFIFTNAPGRSASNRVERRMAPLSRALSGVILPHDEYGNHLDGNGNTINEELEKKNFAHAGKVLEEIWSEMCIDGYNVTAEFIPIDEPTESVHFDNTDSVGSLWYCNHVRESQYLLQIVKCDDENCCSPYRSNIRQILYQRFFPGPFPLTQPLAIPSPSSHSCEKFAPFLLRQSLTIRPEYPRTKEIPYDLYCPSVKSDMDKRTCPDCGLYFASKVSVDCHRKSIHKKVSTVSRVQPLRVLSRRPGELLCLLSEADVEWVDIETVEDVQPLIEEPVPNTPICLSYSISISGSKMESRLLKKIEFKVFKLISIRYSFYNVIYL